jgi:hypothetical protein
MENGIQELLAQITSVQWIAVLVIFALAIIGLARFTDAVERLHSFWKRAWTEFKGRGKSDPKLMEQFDALRRNILYCGLANNIPVELHNLRSFFIEKGLIEKPGIGPFCERWLSSPSVITGMAVVNAFSREELNQLMEELNALQL